MPFLLFSPDLLIVNKQVVALLACMPLKSARNYTDFIVVLSKSGSNISQPFLSWYQKSECKPESIINPRRIKYAKHYRLYGPL